ncbi:MAG: SUMF1/EgtB/PvdO family nonheme iron enzyme [Verrucomicrobiota bacterium]
MIERALPVVGWLLAAALLAGCDSRSAARTVSPEGAKPSVLARPDAPYENALAMKFIPLPGASGLMCIWETRVGDYQQFMQATGGQWPAAVHSRPDHPIHNVSWNDALAFCRWLTEHERKLGRIGPRDQYRLPTDQEWDRAIGPARFPWGPKWPTMSEWDKLPGYKPADGGNLAPVGSFAANQQGFHDLGGNLYEWCMDWYTREMNSSEIRLEYERLNEDGGGRRYKVLRGAPWVFFDPINTLAGYRFINLPEARGGLYGFRCVLEFDARTPLPTASGGKGWTEPPPFDARQKSGRGVYHGRCSECHHLFDAASYSAEEWDMWLGKMRGKAKLKDHEFGDVLHFLKSIRTE